MDTNQTTRLNASHSCAFVAFVATLCGLLIAGCASSASPQVGAAYEGPLAPTVVRTEPWQYGGDAGVVIHTPHYDLFTTVADADVRRRLADVMEGAMAQYQRVAPGVPAGGPAMQCFVFGTRAQWARFTRQHTQGDAVIYLQINRGGYTVRDWYVAYDIGEAATLSVAAHEGWHQFVSRHFKGRLPPFLEEGIATMFEDISWRDELPRWNLRVNRTRVQALRRAVEGEYLYPLSELVQLHAGNVVGKSGNRIEAFYAQDWAFATFLWAGENGRYRPALRRLMSDTADGSVYDPTGSHQDASRPWSPQGVGPMLEHYLGTDLKTLDAAYQKYTRTVAFDDYDQQWNGGG